MSGVDLSAADGPWNSAVQDPGGRYCTATRHQPDRRPPGPALIDSQRAHRKVVRRRGRLGTASTVNGVACMAGRDDPSALVHWAGGTGTDRVEGMHETAARDAVVACAAQDAISQDCRTSAVAQPVGLAALTTGRLPPGPTAERCPHVGA